jgi:hypothetical protein
VYVVGEVEEDEVDMSVVAVVVDVDFMPMAHFCIRQPQVAGSWTPIVCLQFAHLIRFLSVVSSLEESCLHVSVEPTSDISKIKEQCHVKCSLG